MTKVLTLTKQQERVLRGIDRGRTHAAIAAELGVSPNAVKQHIMALKLKLRVDHARELPHAAREKGLLDAS